MQPFDLQAAKSLMNRRFHEQIPASYCASTSNEGTAVNPLRADLIEKMKDSGLSQHTIEELQQMAEQMVGKKGPIRYTEKVV